MIARLLYWLARNRPCRLIKLDGQPYLERYYLGKCRGKYFYLHRFVRSDHERHLHDHPWRKAWSVVLTGFYTELRGLLYLGHITMWPARVTHFNTLEARRCFVDLHRITSVRPETWTLFWHTEWVRPWGFFEITAPHARDESLLVGPRGWRYQQYPKNEDPRWWLTASRAKHIGREPFGR